MERHDYLVNLKDSFLSVRQQEFPSRKSSVETVPSCYRVTLANHVSIPQWGMLESPASDEKGYQVDGVLIGRTLVDMQKETTHLRVMNLSRELKVVRRGAMLACCEPVVSVVTPRSLVPPGRITGISRGATLEELPGHLQPLFHHCANGLETTEKEVVSQPATLPLF